MRFEELKEFIFQKLRDELPATLTYHGFHHTQYVYDAALRIAEHECVTGDELCLLLTGVILHDVGFLSTYANHEEEGCRFAERILPEYEYTPEQIVMVKAMIMRTKIPQSANNRLEEILCDADLDYLGTDDFLKIGDQLFREFLHYGVVKDEKDWNRLQVKFLSGHRYFTAYSKENRSRRKQENFEMIRKIVETYDQ
jgi:HD superfamily phosphodiesterase